MSDLMADERITRRCRDIALFFAIVTCGFLMGACVVGILWALYG